LLRVVQNFRKILKGLSREQEGPCKIWY